MNPARSTGVAFFAETAALSQLWAFWVAPIVGAIGAVLYRAMAKAEDSIFKTLNPQLFKMSGIYLKTHKTTKPVQAFERAF